MANKHVCPTCRQFISAELKRRCPEECLAALEKSCRYCSKVFVPLSRSGSFCSLSCCGLWTAKHRGQNLSTIKKCEFCEKEFKVYASVPRYTCSLKCGYALKKRKTVESRSRCEACGKPVRHAKNRFCSRECVKRPTKRGVKSWSGLYKVAQRTNPKAKTCACGAPGRHRHHPDYSKPEEVIWMCNKCHRRLHGKHKSRPSKSPEFMPKEETYV